MYKRQVMDLEIFHQTLTALIQQVVVEEEPDKIQVDLLDLEVVVMVDQALL